MPPPSRYCGAKECASAESSAATCHCSRLRDIDVLRGACVRTFSTSTVICSVTTETLFVNERPTEQFLPLSQLESLEDTRCGLEERANSRLHRKYTANDDVPQRSRQNSQIAGLNDDQGPGGIFRISTKESATPVGFSLPSVVILAPSLGIVRGSSVTAHGRRFVRRSTRTLFRYCHIALRVRSQQQFIGNGIRGMMRCCRVFDKLVMLGRILMARTTFIHDV